MNGQMGTDVREQTRHASLRIILVVAERMRSSECLYHWLATGKAPGLKNSAPVRQLPIL